jgi:hypothetical protein
LLKTIFLPLIFCLFCLIDCDILKHEYADWESLMDAPENEKGWFPSLFRYNLLLENNIFNIVVFNDLDTNKVWGKFVYLNNIYKDLPLQINPYINNDRDKHHISKIGFDNSKIELYFTESQDNGVWYYFIDTDERIIYFFNFEPGK